MKIIQIYSQNLEPLSCKVDDDDYLWLNSFAWHQHKVRASPIIYARSSCCTMFMHNKILGRPKYMVTDHIDGDGLNNTRDNLRLCLKSDNAANRHRRKEFRYMFGVQKHYLSDIYRAGLTIMNKNIKLSYVKSETEAAYMYDWLARIAHGEFATQNFTDQKSYTIPLGKSDD